MSGSGRPPVLVIGIGNPDRGDDGVGPAIVRWLGPRVPPGVSVLERGGDALALIEDWDGAFCVILVDAVAPVSESGQVHRIDLAEDPLPVAFTSPSTHAFGLAETVELARTLGRLPSFLVLYLVECEQFAAGAPLSPTAAKAVEKAAARILSEIANWIDHA